MENSNAGDIILNAVNSIENVKPYLAQNDIVGAKNFLNEFLRINPNHTQAMFILAQLKEAEGDFKEAANLYEKVFGKEIPEEFLTELLWFMKLPINTTRYMKFLNKYITKTKKISMFASVLRTHVVF